MGSGKYSALSGAISRMQMLDNINSNLANASTPAYKKGVAVFESQLNAATLTLNKQVTSFPSISGEIIDFSQGQINRSGNPMHLAINGKGFFRVQTESGEIVYARRGNFQLDANGEVITSSGAKLLDEGDAPIVLPMGEVTITGDGRILAENQQVGLIPLYDFADTSVLKRGVNGVFIAPQNVEPTLSLEPEMLQGHLEGSNVNVMQETARMVSNMRVFETAQKALTAYDNMDSKLAELGLIQ